MAADGFTDLPEIEALAEIFTYRDIKKGAMLLAQGEVETHIAFVVKGFFRYYYITAQGEEITKHFAVEGDFVSAYASMLYQRPSAYGIIAEEASTILTLPYATYLGFVEQDRSWERMARKYTESIYNLKEIREASLLLLDAKARYLEFIAQYPKLLGRAKQKHIATFLGIHPVTLSKLRNAR